MKTIVVLGAGIAALPIIRQTMRQVVLKSTDYKLIVIAPNTHMLFPIAMPRAIVPGQMQEDKYLIPLSKQFAQYPKDKFEHILGAAEALDPEGKTVRVGEREVQFDTLIVATGSTYKEDVPWKILESTDKTRSAIREFQEQIQASKSIVIVGAGPTGSEIAGELGFEYSKHGKKEVTLIYSGDQPLLEGMMSSVRKQARVELERLNVKLVSNTTVTKVTKEGKETTLELTGKDGKKTTMKTEAYIPATGVKPNASFAPPSMLDATGHLKQSKTLQSPSHPSIFIVGDAGNLEDSKASIADEQAVHLIKNLPAHLLQGKAMPERAVNTKEMYAVTLGRSKATGQMGGWKLPSVMLWWVKGRTMFTEAAEGIAMGIKTTSTVFEK